ncbi:HxlR family transcriptional regulator [Mycolicibacterium arabiense]|uniref:HxlR family transcriptional regulator n=2 Tax=Mycobacteriaceae TaxID=1762 RepID=A0A7I7S5G2_9MYCO|nr:winged helix-turn-helix transcriptional regulator [Mycolicibacterium arabiense]MCV7372516.1 helix-turn-helix transcriptional regulator [Mycolicibacterium arabiense]BBY51641.1 HxlR family transcriptional regulator [Mycolicibacterium arabiense]
MTGVNAVGRMLGVLGDEWTLLIVQQALLGAARYGDFTARLPISHAVLTGRLKTMTAEDLVTRRVYQDRPVRAEYVLTQRGRALWPVLASVWAWERQWVPRHGDGLPAMHHRACGADVAPVLVCRSCREPTSEKELRVRWGPSGSWPRSVPVLSTRRRSSPDTGRSAPGLFPETMTILGNRWAFAVVVAAFVGTSRFGDFEAQLAVPPSTLADRLATLTDRGILANASGPYLLTKKGRAVLPVLITALQWAEQWYPAAEGPAVLLHHIACGAAFHGALACDSCAEILRGNQLERVWHSPS